MTYTLYQIDAFTNKLFSGNPAAVIPLEEWLDTALMQKIALENNLSETVFFVAAKNYCFALPFLLACPLSRLTMACRKKKKNLLLNF